MKNTWMWTLMVLLLACAAPAQAQSYSSNGWASGGFGAHVYHAYGQIDDANATSLRVEIVGQFEAYVGTGGDLDDGAYQSCGDYHCVASSDSGSVYDTTASDGLYWILPWTAGRVRTAFYYYIDENFALGVEVTTGWGGL
jgi:hypothetical protein